MKIQIAVFALALTSLVGCDQQMKSDLQRKVITQRFIENGKVNQESWRSAFSHQFELIDGADIFVSMDEWIENDSNQEVLLRVSNLVRKDGGHAYNITFHGRLLLSSLASSDSYLTFFDSPGEKADLPSDFTREIPSIDSGSLEKSWVSMNYNLYDYFQIPIQGAMSRYKAWFLLPDQVIGPFYLSVGENRWTHDATMNLKTMSRPARDRLPWGFQPEHRPWKPLPFQSDLIPAGIHLEWTGVERHEPKLVVSYNLPWQPGDRVKLDMDPFVLQELDVPEGIKSILLFGFSRNENSVLGLDVPASPNGLGRCFGKVELDLRDNPYFRPDYAIQSLFAVSGEDLAGPLPAIADGLPVPRGPRPEM